MSFEEAPKNMFKPLVIDEDGYQNVLVNFMTIDSLVGRLMEMCELNGDVEQRNALKRQIKQITRGWLRDQYSDAGAGEWGDLKEHVKLSRLQFLTKAEIEEEKKKNSSEPQG